MSQHRECEVGSPAVYHVVTACKAATVVVTLMLHFYQEGSCMYLQGSNVSFSKFLQRFACFREKIPKLNSV